MTYTVGGVVCDYGVFEVYLDQNGEEHKDLKLICNSRHNAILIADIMKKDLRGERLELPSVTPQEPKTGHWKRISMDKYSEHAKYWYECDKCGEHNLGDTNFCPNCGADMRGEQDG